MPGGVRHRGDQEEGSFPLSSGAHGGVGKLAPNQVAGIGANDYDRGTSEKDSGSRRRSKELSLGIQSWPHRGRDS